MFFDMLKETANPNQQANWVFNMQQALQTLTSEFSEDERSDILEAVLDKQAQTGSYVNGFLHHEDGELPWTVGDENTGVGMHAGVSGCPHCKGCGAQLGVVSCETCPDSTLTTREVLSLAGAFDTPLVGSTAGDLHVAGQPSTLARFVAKAATG